jgi:arylsulfatase A-like enzyme
VPLIVSWPDGLTKPGRVADDLVEFTDIMPTLCAVAGAELPANYPGDGASILPIIQNPSATRQKDWVHLWYRGNVIVRDRHYSLLAKANGSNAKLIRYDGPFQPNRLADSALSEPERAIKSGFQATLQRLAKTRLSSVKKKPEK